MAEPQAQGQPDVPARSLVASRRAVRAGCHAVDAARPLSRLSRLGPRPELGGVLAALAGIADLAERTAMVPVAASDPQRPRCNALLACPAGRRAAGPSLKLGQ